MRSPLCDRLENDCRGGMHGSLRYEQLSFESSEMNRIVPRGAGSDRRVEDDPQLAHAGDDADLLGLFCGDEALVEVPDHTIESDGGKRGHLESAPNRGAPAEGAALAAHLSGIAIERGDPDQGGDLAASVLHTSKHNRTAHMEWRKESTSIRISFLQ